MIRLFIALLIPVEIRKQIIDIRNKAFPNFENYRWEAEDKLHLTLKFIGEVENDLVYRAAEEIKFIEDYKSFNCSLTRFGFFYNRKEAKVLWLGLKINDEVNGLVERLNKQLELFSILPEKKKFNPHLTIKRLRGNEENNFVKSFEDYPVPEISFTASKAALIKSELLPAGSKYSEIKIYNLK